MKIYIASSWKNQHAVEMLTDILRAKGHEIISFVEKAVSDEGRSNLQFDVDAWIQSHEGAKKFDYDLDGAMNSDLVIYIGPSGTDAWAEIGAAWASGVPIIGLWAKGESSGLMRRMMTCWVKDFRDVLGFVDGIEKERKARVELCNFGGHENYVVCPACKGGEA